MILSTFRVNGAKLFVSNAASRGGEGRGGEGTLDYLTLGKRDGPPCHIQKLYIDITLTSYMGTEGH